MPGVGFSNPPNSYLGKKSRALRGLLEEKYTATVGQGKDMTDKDWADLEASTREPRSWLEGWFHERNKAKKCSLRLGCLVFWA